ncbi:hypothetical protein F511_10554 [Dorcoceras hygrometricum]|uniref:Uncharacterized protein n=1 Tax=Dorcoceras hygrometricum TaxID=472368 RepID=A0A2Z7BN98_9LAMI|nr:hypothetical protein F511_10554 [Dorcoceras hygrometricum]
MLRLVPAGGIACGYLLVVQQKKMSTRVKFPVARRGNVVVLLLRLDVQLREIFTTVACDWYRQREVLCIVVFVRLVTQLLVVRIAYPMRRRLRCEGERRYRTLISLLGSLATMSRVVNYHSSWARQQQVELFDASGFTAGRGINPAGGVPGGG